MTAYTFPQLINFTRTSAATYVNSAGLVALTPASRNLLTFTQEFDNAAWTKTGATVTANSTTAPDGTNTADKVVETAAAGVHSAAQTLVSTAGTVVTYSVYLKAAERTFAGVYAGVPGQGIIVNLSNGAFVSNMVAAPSSYIITPISSGWYRVSITYTTTGTSTVSAVYTCDASAAFSYTGDGTSGIYVWGAQLEQAAAATDYTKNVGGLYPPRFDYDPVTLAPKGLLIEEQRTNLLTYSEQFGNAAWTKTNATISQDAAVSPDGTTDADKLVENTATGVHDVRRNVAASASTAHTQSIFVKASGRTRGQMQMFGNGGGSTATYDLTAGTATATGAYGGWSSASATITNFGNGWYRITNTATTNTGLTSFTAAYLMADASGSGSYTGDGTSGMFLYGAQVEAGAFATSYIPTVASQVTRTADTAVIAAPNFAPWYNQSEGTFVASVLISSKSPSSYGIYAVDDGTTNNSLPSFYTGAAQANSRVGGSNVFTSTSAPLSATPSILNVAFAYQSANYASSFNGATPTTQASGAVPTGLNRLQLGAYSNVQLNGHIRSIKYFPTRLSNTQLQALTV